MGAEKIPIEVFVMTTLATKQCMTITDNWPIKVEVIQGVVTKHFQELGIYSVHSYGQAEQMLKEVMYVLKNSPILLEMIEKARRIAAQNAARNRGNLAS